MTARLLVLLVALFWTCFGTPAAIAQQPRELRLCTPFVNGSNLHQAMLKFAEVVKTESKGEYKVNVYSDSQIGDCAC